MDPVRVGMGVASATYNELVVTRTTPIIVIMSSFNNYLLRDEDRICILVWFSKF